MSSPIITLTTDFGYQDPFVGIMKGVILDINPFATIIDITHGISPQNILEAAIIIDMCYRAFPPETIHVVVVDPGVGSARRPIIVTNYHCHFIGPDNGIFSLIYNSSERYNVIHITSEHYFLPERSATFHGRVIFAPVAAWFSRGIDISKFGDPISDFVTIATPSPALVNNKTLEGETIYIDRFGNAITNIKTQALLDLQSGHPLGRIRVMLRGKEIPVKNHYSDAEDDSLYSLINSFGYLELFVYKGSASSRFNIVIGEKVSIVVI